MLMTARTADQSHASVGSEVGAVAVEERVTILALLTVTAKFWNNATRKGARSAPAALSCGNEQYTFVMEETLIGSFVWSHGGLFSIILTYLYYI